MSDLVETTKNKSLRSPIDAYVGNRIRNCRILRGMTQEKLADNLGLTFQQIQKYEKGSNRVGASRLFEISRIFDIAVGYFFEDMPAEVTDSPVSGPRGNMLSSEGIEESIEGKDASRLSDREALELIKSYRKIDKVATRHQILALVRALQSPP
jgi:transcriptional regulator with XRE-family HTH domain